MPEPTQPLRDTDLRLWVDDLRPAPPGWHWAKTSRAAIACLTEHRFAEMSLDHDLGGDDTSRPVVLWLCENPDRWPHTVRVHSANPVGVEWLTGMVARYHSHAPATPSTGQDRNQDG